MEKQVNKSMITKVDWSKYVNKDLIAFLISALLAVAAVYLVSPWVRNVMTLGWVSILFNFAAVISTGVTYYIAKTHYNKGAWNVFWKVVMVTIGGSITVFFTIMSSTTMGGLWYPLTGIFIISVIFYMIALSSETIGLLGMVAMAIVSGTLIVGGLVFGKIDSDGAIMWTKIMMVVIFAIGGVFAKWRMYLHGIRGVNNDGGFGNRGDTHDGDGDTEDE